MSHVGSEFEIKNSEGISSFNESTTSETPNEVSNFPATPDKFIETFVLENASPLLDERELGPNIDAILEFSIDGGNNFDQLFAGQGIEFKPKGVQQIQIKSSVANVPFRLTLTFEKFNEER